MMYNYKTKKQGKEVDKMQEVLEKLKAKYPNAEIIAVDSLGNVEIISENLIETEAIAEIEKVV